MATFEPSPDDVDRTDRVEPIAFAPLEVAPLSHDRAADGTRTRLGAAPPPIPATALTTQPSREWLAKLAALSAEIPAVRPPPIPPRARTALPPPRRPTQQVVAVPVIAPPVDLSHDVVMDPSEPVDLIEATPSIPLEAIELLDPRDSTDRLRSSRIPLVERVDVDDAMPMTTYFDRPATTPFFTVRSISAIASALAILTIAYFALRGDAHKAPVAAASVPVAAPAPAPAPAPVAAAVPAPAPVAAAVPAPVPVAAPAPVPVAAPAPVAAPVPVAAPAPARAPARIAATKHPAPARRVATATTPAPATGTLAISTKPPCELIIDGKPSHLITPQRAVRLSAGHHQLSLINATQKVRRSVDVQITAHHQTKVIQDFTKK